MLIAANRRDFMLETRRKSKKINTVLYHRRSKTWLPFQKFTVSITLFKLYYIHTYVHNYLYTRKTVSIILKLQMEFVLLFIRMLNTKRGIDIALSLTALFPLFLPEWIENVAGEDGLLRTSGWLSG